MPGRKNNLVKITITIILIMYIYHELINVLSAHIICINLNMIFYTHTEHSPTRTGVQSRQKKDLMIHNISFVLRKIPHFPYKCAIKTNR